MIVSKNFWFILSFCLVNIGGAYMSCYGSDISHTPSLSSTKSSSTSVKEILEECGVDLGKFENPTKGLSDWGRSQIREGQKKLSQEGLAASTLRAIGSAYLDAIGPSTEYEDWLSLTLEGTRYQLKATELGDINEIFFIGCRLQTLADTEDEELMNRLGGECKLREAAKALILYAAKLGDVQAIESYTLKHLSPPTSRQASLMSSGDPSLGPVDSFDEPPRN